MVTGMRTTLTPELAPWFGHGFGDGSGPVPLMPVAGRRGGVPLPVRGPVGAPAPAPAQGPALGIPSVPDNHPMARDADEAWESFPMWYVLPFSPMPAAGAASQGHHCSSPPSSVTMLRPSPSPSFAGSGPGSRPPPRCGPRGPAPAPCVLAAKDARGLQPGMSYPTHHLLLKPPNFSTTRVGVHIPVAASPTTQVGSPSILYYPDRANWFDPKGDGLGHIK